MSSQVFSVTGLHCQSCVQTVGDRLRAHEAVQKADVSLHPPQITLETHHALGAAEVNAWLAPLQRYQVSDLNRPEAPAEEKLPVSWKPLLLLLTFLLAVTLATQLAGGRFDLDTAMRTFMGGFFIAFSFFKFLDLRGFADAYRGYDLVAKAWPPYGRIYPFLEFGLGFAYIANWQPFAVNIATALLMAVSLAGVIRAVLSKKQIRCACLGTGFNLPMSTVTVIEDGLMFVMAVVMLM
ncbi:MAG TPA: MauE/DoxX family redox-associated membrane protein [Verrucomicrobiales bacterium]|nr:MauE/DoxX family redox-associated membrane protein [Verrucomicrobiales bacterium]